MNFEGTEQFDCDTAQLWAHLTDMNFVSSAIPDLDKVVKIEPTSFSCRVRPKFSFISGSLELHIEIVDSTPQTKLKVRSRGKGIGAAVVVEAEMNVVPNGNGSELKWSGAIISREGLLRPIGNSLIQGAAQRVIESFWKKFRDAIPKK